MLKIEDEICINEFLTDRLRRKIPKFGRTILHHLDKNYMKLCIYSNIYAVSSTISYIMNEISNTSLISKLLKIFVLVVLFNRTLIHTESIQTYYTALTLNMKNSFYQRNFLRIKSFTRETAAFSQFVCISAFIIP